MTTATARAAQATNTCASRAGPGLPSEVRAVNTHGQRRSAWWTNPAVSPNAWAVKPV
ncbi:hypothetical protein [Streptosporangium pseudovulgare]|uniref:hypothetical protein n=1 Tax=Streptosporangium pseudovulgare TaxID=35765 RepID=UPI00166FC44F|nr:hypothetical protein [Streptosporangium pseudovulgare]